MLKLQSKEVYIIINETDGTIMDSSSATCGFSNYNDVIRPMTFKKESSAKTYLNKCINESKWFVNQFRDTPELADIYKKGLDTYNNCKVCKVTIESNVKIL